MSSDGPSALPDNITEFNTIAGSIFAQLYQAFPVRIDISKFAVERVMNVDASENLPSGRSLTEVLASTIDWLIMEGYINAVDDLIPASRVTLTKKGLSAMNAVPSGLEQPLGTALAQAAKEQPQSGGTRIAELIGSLLGSFTKSVIGDGP
jgi:hypothetical protein